MSHTSTIWKATKTQTHTVSPRLALAITATFFEPDPKEQDITCRPHSRLDLWYVLARTVLIVLEVVLPIAFHEDSVVPKWIMALASLAASGSLAFGAIWVSCTVEALHTVGYSLTRPSPSTCHTTTGAGQFFAQRYRSIFYGGHCAASSLSYAHAAILVSYTSYKSR